MIDAVHDLAPYEPRLLVGPGPVGLDDIQALADRGITGLLSLQTDDDLAVRGLRWSTLWQLYTARGITTQRIPIRDFDKKQLANSIAPALDALDALLAAHDRVYVHCTAGLNRSPTLVLAHLSRTLGPDRARAALRERYPGAVPYPNALTKWWKTYAKPSL